MKLTHCEIHPTLKGYVEKIWVFENDGPIPHSDTRIIVPNALVKMVIPFRNALRAKMAGKEIVSPTDTITLIGVADIPSVVLDEREERCASVGIEFSPAGAYRFFNLSLNELKDAVLPLDDVLGKTARQIQEHLANTVEAVDKVELIQRFLRAKLINDGDQIFEYCVRKIIHSKGKIQVAQLEKLTGYSSRWLNMKFFQRIGISPKNLCSIVRFQEIYQGWARTEFSSFDGVDLYEFYHDQAHFIKDFKRFTGFTPTRFQQHENDFGRIFYRG